MDQLLLKNLLLLAILLTVGIVFSFVAIKLIIQIFKRGLDIGEALKNPAIVILFSASILCMGILFSSLHDPLYEIYRILEQTDDVVWQSIKYTLIFLGVSFIVWLLVIGSAISIVSLSTKTIKETDEINAGNWKIGLFLAAIIITLTLLTASPLASVMESIIPYPELPDLF